MASPSHRKTAVNEPCKESDTGDVPVNKQQQEVNGADKKAWVDLVKSSNSQEKTNRRVREWRSRKKAKQKETQEKLKKVFLRNNPVKKSKIGAASCLDMERDGPFPHEGDNNGYAADTEVELDILDRPSQSAGHDQGGQSRTTHWKKSKCLKMTRSTRRARASRDSSTSSSNSNASQRRRKPCNISQKYHQLPHMQSTEGT